MLKDVHARISDTTIQINKLISKKYKNLGVAGLQDFLQKHQYFFTLKVWWLCADQERVCGLLREESGMW